MLVTMELYGLTQRVGQLTPELAMGWQIGKYVRECFDGLGEVRMAAAKDNDAVSALSYLATEHGYPGQVSVSDSMQPWDFLFYHLATGTVLKFILVRKRVELPQELRKLEPLLSVDAPNITRIYQEGVEQLVTGILQQPVENFCLIRQMRYRPLNQVCLGFGVIACHRCGKSVLVQNAWEIEGEISCQSCSGLEASWFQYH